MRKQVAVVVVLACVFAGAVATWQLGGWRSKGGVGRGTTAATTQRPPLPTVAALPRLSVAIEEATLGGTVEGLNEAIGIPDQFRVAGPAGGEATFTLVGETTFAEALHALSAQHPLRLTLGSRRNGMTGIDVGMGAADDGCWGNGLVAIATHLQLGGSSPGDLTGGALMAPILEFQAFVDPRLPVAAVSQPELLVWGDEREPTRNFETERHIWVSPNKSASSNISLRWGESYSRATWEVGIRVFDRSAPGGRAEFSVVVEASDMRLGTKETRPR
jgi:hypothetical protein